jgi:hypothetical protein
MAQLADVGDDQGRGLSLSPMFAMLPVALCKMPVYRDGWAADTCPRAACRRKIASAPTVSKRIPRMSTWRPPSIVRPIAVGVVRRRDELLLMAVRDDDGTLKGWRPLGGAIEFGERAAAVATE